MIKKLCFKEFGFHIELCDFVNKNKIRPDMICKIVPDNGNIVLFYWKLVKLGE